MAPNRTVGKRCWYCGHKLTRKNNSIDHQRPKSRGGSENKKNIVPCCRTCNKDKAHLTVNEYRIVIMFRKGFFNALDLMKFRFHGEADEL